MRKLILLLLSSATLFGQQPETKSTMCQATEVVVDSVVSERRLIGCGEGFPDNLLWHLDRSDSIDGTLDGKVTRRLTGRDVVIYFIDTGVMQAHDEFQRATGSNVIAGLDRGQSSAICPNVAVAPCPTSGSGFSLLIHGHGTGAASVAGGLNNGIAPDAKIVAVMNTNSPAEFDRALRDIIAHAHAPTSPPFHTGIISISASLDIAKGANPALDDLIARMTTGVDASGNADPAGKRFLFVAAAGNKSADPLFDQCTAAGGVKLYPANLGTSTAGVISVGGIDRENRLWVGACNGAGVEMAGPAPDIFVASIYARDTYRFKPEAGVSGTSWSTPYVSGMAARFLELNPRSTPAQLETLLANSPSRVGGLPVPVMAPLPPKSRAARK